MLEGVVEGDASGVAEGRQRAAARSAPSGTATPGSTSFRLLVPVCGRTAAAVEHRELHREHRPAAALGAGVTDAASRSAAHVAATAVRARRRRGSASSRRTRATIRSSRRGALVLRRTATRAVAQRRQLRRDRGVVRAQPAAQPRRRRRRRPPRLGGEAGDVFAGRRYGFAHRPRATPRRAAVRPARPAHCSAVVTCCSAAAEAAARAPSKALTSSSARAARVRIPSAPRCKWRSAYWGRAPPRSCARAPRAPA